MSQEAICQEVFSAEWDQDRDMRNLETSTVSVILSYLSLLYGDELPLHLFTFVHRRGDRCDQGLNLHSDNH